MKSWMVPGVIVVSLFLHWAYRHGTDYSSPTAVSGIVIDKYVIAGNHGPRLLVVIEHAGTSYRETFEVRDTIRDYRAADAFARCGIGEATTGTAYGVRWGFFSQFRRYEPKEGKPERP